VFKEIKTIFTLLYTSIRNPNTYYGVGMFSLTVLMIIFAGKVSKRTFGSSGG